MNSAKMSHDPNTGVPGCSVSAPPATGSGTKLGAVGVRVGLGLLAMGDLARAARTGHDAAAAPQAFRGRGQAEGIPGCGGGPAGGASDRVRTVVARTRGGFVGSFGVFGTASSSAASRGGLTRSIRASRTLSSSGSCSGGTTTRDVLCASMTQLTHEQQQQQQEEAAATATATSSRESTVPVQSLPIPSPPSGTTPQNGATHASASVTRTPVRNEVSSREGDDGWSRGRWARGPGDERGSGRTGLVSRDARASRVDADGMMATESGRNGGRLGGFSPVPVGTSAPSVVDTATITTPIAQSDQVDYLLYSTERRGTGVGPLGGQEEGGPPEVISRTGRGDARITSTATNGVAPLEGSSRTTRPSAPASARATASQNGRVDGSLSSGPRGKGGLGATGGTGRERLGVISRERGADGHAGATGLSEGRLGVISRAKDSGISAGARAGGRRQGPVSRAGKGSTGMNAGSGGGERLGVISRSGDAGARVGPGGSRARTGVLQRVHDEAAKKAKVKDLYFTAVKLIKQKYNANATDEGLALLKEALELDPFDGHSWLLLARTLDWKGESNDARDAFQAATIQNPRNVHLWQAWGLLEEKFGNQDKARELFQKGLEADEGNPFVCHAWGRMEEREGNFDRAREILKSSRPKAAIATTLGELEASQGNLEEARRTFQEALDRLAAIEDREAKRVVPLGQRPSRRSREDSTERPGEILAVWAKCEEQHGGDPERAKALIEETVEGDPRNVSGHIEWARFMMRKSNNEKARLILSKAADLPMKDGCLFNLWATLEAKEGNLGTALQITDAAIKRFPDDMSLLQTQGTVLGRLGRYADAVKCYRRSLAFKPAAPAYVAWALVVSKLAFQKQAQAKGAEASEIDAITGSVDAGKAEDDDDGDGLKISHEEARRLFELGIKTNPNHGPLFNAYGGMETKLGNHDRARKVYERGVAARCSGRASVWAGLGHLEAARGDKDKAKEVFRQGIEDCATEDVAFLYHAMGTLELSSGRPVEARAVFAEATRRYPANTQLLLGAALVEAKNDDLDIARDLFKRAVQADPFHAHAWQAWGLMESRAGNHEVARTLWESGLKSCPKHGPLWQAYAVMEVNLGEFERARKLFKAGIERCRDHVHLHQAWAVMEGREGNLEEARKLVLEGLRINPHHGALWTVYAIVEQQTGSEKRARKVFELGSRACPTHGPLFRAWGFMEFQEGRTAEARRVFEKGLEVDPTHSGLYYGYADLEAIEGNSEAFKWLTDRGEEALTAAGASPSELEKFLDRMDSIAAAARFDAKAYQDREKDAFDLD